MSGLPPESPMPEAYATLGVLAGQTRNIRLGTLVTSVAYRHPGVLLKTVTTLDVLSGGRMYLGVGVGAPFNPEPQGPGTRSEVEGLGIPFPPLTERFEMLEELLRIAHTMWDGDETPYEGKHYRLVRPLNSPNSVRRPRPPILVAGGGERRTLPMVARYADARHLPDLPSDQQLSGRLSGDLADKLAILREHCAAAGRDYADIEKTVGTGLDLTDAGFDALRKRADELAALGVDHVMLAPSGPWTENAVDALAAVLPEIHAITPAGR
jgi:alkanesulfonate monooxygenase SsuD/methylene tetrahydromethanopterin reductase-like flavin-dependent oxidoreductase (luciferase family)